MRLPWFVPVSFVSGLTSAIVGAGGLLANPFYLDYGLTKERMLATRAVNSLVIQLVKIAAYLAFGVLNWDLVRHGALRGCRRGHGHLVDSALAAPPRATSLPQIRCVGHGDRRFADPLATARLDPWPPDRGVIFISTGRL